MDASYPELRTRYALFEYHSLESLLPAGSLALVSRPQSLLIGLPLICLKGKIYAVLCNVDRSYGVPIKRTSFALADLHAGANFSNSNGLYSNLETSR